MVSSDLFAAFLEGYLGLEVYGPKPAVPPAPLKRDPCYTYLFRLEASTFDFPLEEYDRTNAPLVFPQV